LIDLIVLGLGLIDGSTGSFLQAEHIFNLPFCNKTMIIFIVEVPGKPFCKIQVSEADKNMYSKQEYYLYVY
jgi:hypothetical protein